MLRTRKWYTFIEHEEDSAEGGNKPLRKVAIVAVVENPYANQQVGDLTPLITASEDLGRQIGRMLIEVMGPYEVQSYGKAGIAGLAGEQEHANALLTTAFADPLRAAVNGGRAWISSFT
jgi:hypothetical protein